MSAPQKRPEHTEPFRNDEGPTWWRWSWKLGSHMSSWTWGPKAYPICALYEFFNQGTAIHWRMASSGLGSNINARMDSKHFKTVSAGFQDSFKISKPRWCRHVKHLRRPKTVGCFLNESPRTNDLVQTICFILGVVVSLRLDTFNWFLRDTPQFQAVFAIGVAGGRKRKSPANNKEAQNMS